jgi:hypothetical protein
VSDPNPPFSWNLPPKRPEDAEAAAQHTNPPQQQPQQPPVAPPPAWPTTPPQQTAPPQAQPPVWPTTPPQAQPPVWPTTPPQAAPSQPAPPQAAPPQWPSQQTTPPPLVQPPAPQAPPPGWPPQAQPPQPTFPPQQPRPNYADVPTQAIAFDPGATQAMPFDPSLNGPTEVLGAQPVGLPELRDESPRQAPASAIDALFGESQFKEYDASAFPSEGISALASTRPREPRAPLGTTQKVLLWVAGSLVAALALVGLFVVGTKLPALFPPPQEEAAPVASQAPAIAQPLPVGPIAVGEHDWDALLGTECIDPYVSAWQEKYTVVDCAAPHAAQMVFHGIFADEAWAPYPGAAELQSRINLLCTSPTTVNYEVARQYSDIQIAASYAATEQQWLDGERDYYCFVSRSSGQPLEVSVANPPVVAEGLTATVPGNDP